MVEQASDQICAGETAVVVGAGLAGLLAGNQTTDRIALDNGDQFMHLADLRSYLEADRRLLELHGNQDAWARKAILNVASSGKSSSDRTIAKYTADIWKVKPCPIP